MSHDTDCPTTTDYNPDFYYQKIVTAIGMVLETDDLSELHPHTDLERDLGFESGIFIELLMYLEEMIEGFSIDPVALDSQQLSSIDSLGRFIHLQRECNIP
ncbi:acyl carrier protein [Dickeya oryzae]|uniref:phosphopantetheine-binding protein n=1 Tax=Dickeya oryzae TaxID=1240404 RepID=UPI001AECBB4D|nr:phosphopantetheine-binding protein [Dickeya oryzae]MBP2847427.1 acyl carrier protein [Dickeya oryzae]